jgi:biotin-(acetyl-CoA carboxylase) ligase
MSKVIEFYNKNLFWYQERVSIKDNNNSYEGELLGINKQGQLMIQNNGNIERIDNIDSTMRRL